MNNNDNYQMNNQTNNNNNINDNNIFQMNNNINEIISFDNISDQDIIILKEGFIVKIIILKNALYSLNNPSNNNNESLIQQIKRNFNEEWFIFVTEKDYQDFYFKFTDIKEEQIMILSINNLKSMFFNQNKLSNQLIYC